MAMLLLMMGAQATGLQAPAYWLRVGDVQGSYTIPYIQSGRDLCVCIDFASLPAETVGATVTLGRTGEAESRQRTVSHAAPLAEFTGLPAGEYSLTATATDAAGTDVWNGRYHHVGVGTVVAALGDSLTEGYHGHGFGRLVLDLEAGDFPAEAVSADGRNYPQFAPTTAHHKPSVTCFQSWMTRLNNGLTAAWQQPVFIANEGWGGYATGHYLAMMRGNHGGWRDRMQLLHPTVWLIHLGVNDERQQVPADAFAGNLRMIVGILRTEYGASTDAIYIAHPSYDYAPGAGPVLREYIARIDAIVTELGLRHGPDFFAAFATDRKTWYGADPVHPGPDGVDLMADLWLETLAPSRPGGAQQKTPPTLVVPTPIPCRFLSALQQGRQQTIVTYGTSLTAGGAWVGDLRTELDCRFPGLARVVNGGMGAMNSDWGLSNVDERVVAAAPDAVFIEFSVNDAYLPYNPDLARCEANLRAMIQRIREARPTCEIILMVMNPMVDIHAERRPDLERFNDVYRRAARELDLLLIDHYGAWQIVLSRSRAEFDRLVPDGAHPGELGCARIVTPEIVRALELHGKRRGDQ